MLWTQGSAWFSSEQNQKGQIKVGQLADLAVLSKDYFRVPEEEIKGIESVLTVVNGDIVYAAGSFGPLAPPAIPVLPEWSPVVKVPGHYRSAPPQAARVGMSPIHHCSGPCGVHSHQHDFARTSAMPVSDDNAFWGGAGLQLLCILMKNTTMPPRIDLGLFFLRLTGSLLLLYVHGLPKVLHFSEELTRIEDPFGFGPYASLIPAIVAEVICPLLIIAGVYTRLACLPIIAVLLVAMLAVHPNWSIAEGQFGWLLLIIFTTLALTGPGQWRLQRKATERFA